MKEKGRAIGNPGRDSRMKPGVLTIPSVCRPSRATQAVDRGSEEKCRLVVVLLLVITALESMEA